MGLVPTRITVRQIWQDMIPKHAVMHRILPHALAYMIHTSVDGNSVFMIIYVLPNLRGIPMLNVVLSTRMTAAHVFPNTNTSCGRFGGQAEIKIPNTPNRKCVAF